MLFFWPTTDVYEPTQTINKTRDKAHLVFEYKHTHQGADRRGCCWCGPQSSSVAHRPADMMKRGQSPEDRFVLDSD